MTKNTDTPRRGRALAHGDERLTQAAAEVEATPSQTAAAERIEWALAARRAGVPSADVTRAFGIEADELAQLAGRLAQSARDGARISQPSASFTRRLEAALESEFESHARRPIETSWLPLVGRSRLRQVAAVTTLAVVLAAATLLLSGNGLGSRPAIATAAAATETATPTVVGALIDRGPANNRIAFSGALDQRDVSSHPALPPPRLAMAAATRGSEGGAATPRARLTP